MRCYIVALLSVVVAKEYYNILAIDGGGIRGIIPGVILDKMEKYAFEYATLKKYKF